MKKDIFRTIAVVTGIFMLTLSIMLVANYFQVRNITPLETEVMTLLKSLNEANPDNTELQAQIRQLDLLSRKAYFVQEEHLKTGIYILLFMAAVFVYCLRGYYADVLHIAPKDIDVFDEWLVKSRSRKYVQWLTASLTIVALIIVVASNPQWLKSDKAEEDSLLAEQTEVASADNVLAEATPTEAPAEAPAKQVTDTPSQTPSEEPTTSTESVEQSAPAPTVAPATQRVNHGMFRGNNSNGHSQARNIPTSWDFAGGGNILWKHSLTTKQGFSSPAVYGNRIFYTGGDEVSRELYCHDLTTGDLLWTLPATGITGSPSTPPTVASNTGYASASPATDGRYVCAIFATGDIICADMDGKRVWAKNLGVPDNQYGFVSSLLVWNGMVFVQYDNSNSQKIIAMDIATGNVRWQKDRNQKVCWSSPIIATVGGQAQLVLMGNPEVRAYNPSTGEQLWSVSGMAGEVCPSPCSGDGVIFAANEYAKLMAINGADGSVLWESTEYLPEVASPVYANGRVYIATTYGVLAAFDAKTGELKAERELEMELYGSPMVVDGKIYIIGTSGRVFVFTADDNLQQINKFETDEMTYATPAFLDGKVIIRSLNTLYCVAQ